MDLQISGTENSPVTTFSLATNSSCKNQNDEWNLKREDQVAQSGGVQAGAAGAGLWQRDQGDEAPSVGSADVRRVHGFKGRRGRPLVFFART